MMNLEGACIVALAFLIDWIIGDPPNRYHPVAWMGTAIAWAKRRALSTTPRHRKRRRFLHGLLLVLIGGAIVFGVGILIERACAVIIDRDYALGSFPGYWIIMIQAWVLKSCFGGRSLAAAAHSVAGALRQGDVAEARHRVAYHLVSRDVSKLNEAELSAATIESVAENTSDSVVAPLLYYAIAGLPGALLYRFVNTCDAMLGYRTKELEWFGKASARADDLLNLIPARITAGLIFLATFPSVQRCVRSVRVWWRDARLTASPNAGHPMSAAAGALGVMLEKKHHYRLGEGLPMPDELTIHRMLGLFRRCVLLAALLACVAVALKPLFFARLI